MWYRFIRYLIMAQSLRFDLRLIIFNRTNKNQPIEKTHLPTNRWIVVFNWKQPQLAEIRLIFSPINKHALKFHIFIWVCNNWKPESISSVRFYLTHKRCSHYRNVNRPRLGSRPQYCNPEMINILLRCQHARVVLQFPAILLKSHIIRAAHLCRRSGSL